MPRLSANGWRTLIVLICLEAAASLSFQPHVPSLLTELLAGLAFLIGGKLINLTLGFVITWLVRPSLCKWTLPLWEVKSAVMKQPGGGKGQRKRRRKRQRERESIRYTQKKRWIHPRQNHFKCDHTERLRFSVCHLASIQSGFLYQTKDTCFHITNTTGWWWRWDQSKVTMT